MSTGKQRKSEPKAKRTPTLADQLVAAIAVLSDEDLRWYLASRASKNGPVREG
jgi:hypothetical protein